MLHYLALSSLTLSVLPCTVLPCTVLPCFTYVICLALTFTVLHLHRHAALNHDRLDLAMLGHATLCMRRRGTLSLSYVRVNKNLVLGADDRRPETMKTVWRAQGWCGRLARCGAGILLASPCAGAGRPRDSGRDARTTIFRAGSLPRQGGA